MKLATDIVIACLNVAPIAPADLPDLVRALRRALTDDVSCPASRGVVAPDIDEAVRPAVAPENSVFPDCLISLEDGQRYRSLKRHLMSKYGMTPDDYRRKWGLPLDYPMVAPSYAKERSEVAKRIGLGLRAPAAASIAPKPKGAARASTKRKGG
jgi:predicted transcriptional regulator